MKFADFCSLPCRAAEAELYSITRCVPREVRRQLDDTITMLADAPSDDPDALKVCEGETEDRRVIDKFYS
jgi:hypothetical protein